MADYVVVLNTSNNKKVLITSGGKDELQALVDMLNETVNESKSKGKFELRQIEPDDNLDELNNDIELLSNKMSV
jgi:hypothetical protein